MPIVRLPQLPLRQCYFLVVSLATEEIFLLSKLVHVDRLIVSETKHLRHFGIITKSVLYQSKVSKAANTRG